MQIKSYYGARANERRRQFNNIIRGCDMVLMNNIPEVDPSIWENWGGKDPLGNDECTIIDQSLDNGKSEKWCCETHGKATDNEYECEDYESTSEVFQWYAVSDSDADFLKRHNQYITYSNMLDTYFLAICHFGTSWDYVDSMVTDFEDCYVGLENFDDAE